jgi:hypothetical protein
MPETGYDSYDFDQEPVAQRGDYLVRVPRGAIRHLEKKAATLDALRDAGVLDDLVGQAGDGTPQPVDTPLEDGEADLTGERRRLAQGAPPDRVQATDPYQVAREIHDKVLEDGGQEKHAIGAAINSLVNAAHRGDQRVILSNPSGRRG